MKEVTAVDLRKSLKTLAKSIEKEPVLVKLGQTPVGVLVSMKDFREKFSLEAARADREKIVAEILANQVRPKETAEETIARVRRR